MSATRKASSQQVKAGVKLSDPTAAIGTTAFATKVDKFEELISRSNRAFLIGAGCSSCAGLPLTSELTQLIFERPMLSAETKDVLGSLRGQFGSKGTATIEDYMSELVDLLAIAERREDCNADTKTLELNGKGYALDALRRSLLEIKDAIANIIDEKQRDASTHLRFIKAVHRRLRSGKTGPTCPVDYLVLNYDTLIEDALALGRLDYIDGFRGGPTAWWDPTKFDMVPCDAHVLKIHGSIDWYELEDGSLPWRIRPTLQLPKGSRKKVLIYPAATKYNETQKDPYAQILAYMRTALRPTADSEVVLTACGYRFADSHINAEIDRALRNSNKALTLVIFTECEEPQGQIKKWVDDVSVRDQVLVYAKRGFFHALEAQHSDEDLQWWKFEILTSILEGKRHI